MSFDLAALINLTVALLGGLAVGIEREWSGHSKGSRARFAGVRTFTLLALVSGLSGWLWISGLQGVAVVFLAGLGLLIVAAYLSASKRDVDGTTEVAAFVVMATGVLAGTGNRAVASGIIAITVLLLFEKKRLHTMVKHLSREELRAATRFAVMAAVILPVLPTGPYGPWQTIRPRMLWALVLFFSGLSFAGYVARKIFGGERGYAVAGALGGVVSSTNTTYTLAQISQKHESAGRALASGALGANMMLYPRLIVATAVLAPALAKAVWPSFVVPTLIGLALLLRGWRDTSKSGGIERDDSPLQLGAAIKMALIFQVVVIVMAAATSRLGTQGLYGSSVLSGLVDMDALSVSLSQQTTAGLAAEQAARALTLGVLTNTIVKMGIAAAIGRGTFRILTLIGLAAMAVALAAAIFWR